MTLVALGDGAEGVALLESAIVMDQDDPLREL